MAVYQAPGLTADWLNAWLAALGATALVPGARLCWSAGPRPAAVFDTVEGSLPDVLAQVLPSIDDFDEMAIARVHRQSDHELPRNVPLAAYGARAALARRQGDPTLAATLTDLGPRERSAEAAHGPFDPPAPKGITIWERARSCRVAIGDADLSDQIHRSFTSSGRRILGNGLGFDHRRLLSPTDPNADVFVDPVIEVLAFCGMALLPVRGDGTRDRARGWTAHALRRGSFSWPTWAAPLTIPALDAFLDLFWSTMARHGSSEPAKRDSALYAVGATAVFSSVPYQPRGQMDQTRAYASERLL